VGAAADEAVDDVFGCGIGSAVAAVVVDGFVGNSVGAGVEGSLQHIAYTPSSFLLPPKPQRCFANGTHAALPRCPVLWPPVLDGSKYRRQPSGKLPLPLQWLVPRRFTALDAALTAQNGSVNSYVSCELAVFVNFTHAGAQLVALNEPLSRRARRSAGAHGNHPSAQFESLVPCVYDAVRPSALPTTGQMLVSPESRHPTGRAAAAQPLLPGVGAAVGAGVGLWVGAAVGLRVVVGDAVGALVGVFVGVSVGDTVGALVGEAVGHFVGAAVGSRVVVLFILVLNPRASSQTNCWLKIEPVGGFFRLHFSASSAIAGIVFAMSMPRPVQSVDANTRRESGRLPMAQLGTLPSMAERKGEPGGDACSFPSAGTNESHGLHTPASRTNLAAVRWRGGVGCTIGNVSGNV
jgi:hypothetical protein